MTKRIVKPGDIYNRKGDKLGRRVVYAVIPEVGYVLLNVMNTDYVSEKDFKKNYEYVGRSTQDFEKLFEVACEHKWAFAVDTAGGRGASVIVCSKCGKVQV